MSRFGGGFIYREALRLAEERQDPVEAVEGKFDLDKIEARAIEVVALAHPTMSHEAHEGVRLGIEAMRLAVAEASA